MAGHRMRSWPNEERSLNCRVRWSGHLRLGHHSHRAVGHSAATSGGADCAPDCAPDEFVPTLSADLRMVAGAEGPGRFRPPGNTDGRPLSVAVDGLSNSSWAGAFRTIENQAPSRPCRTHNDCNISG